MMACLVGYDMWASFQGYEFTITAVIRDLSKAAPVIPLGAGLVMGFWIGYAKHRKLEELKALRILKQGVK